MTSPISSAVRPSRRWGVEAVATHVAGHAVAAYLYGLPTTGVSIVDGEDDDSCRSWSNGHGAPVDEEIVVALAGSVAEVVLTGAVGSSGTRDIEHCFELLLKDGMVRRPFAGARVSADVDLWPDALRDAWYFTKDLLIGDWPAVFSVSMDLVAAGELDEDEVLLAIQIALLHDSQS